MRARVEKVDVLGWNKSYEQMLCENNLQLTELNSILHQQHRKVSRFSGYFICKETRSSVQHFHERSTILQVDYLSTTQQDQPIYIPHNFSLHEHMIHTYSLHLNTYNFSLLPFLPQLI